MKNKKLSSAVEIINSKIARINAEKAENASKAEADQGSLERIKLKLKEATENGNFEAYKQAKTEAEFLEARIQLFEDWQRKNKQYTVTKAEEYQKTVNDIKALQEEIISSETHSIYEKLGEIKNIIDGYNSAIVSSNDIIYRYGTALNIPPDTVSKNIIPAPEQRKINSLLLRDIESFIEIYETGTMKHAGTINTKDWI